MASSNYTNTMRVFALMTGCVAVGMSYIINTFNVFALALKDLLNLTQIQLELTLAIMFLGLISSLPGGVLLEKLEAKLTSAIALAFSVTGYLLIWHAVNNPIYYSHHFYVLLMYFFIAGVGGGFTYITGTASNVRNFGHEVRGTVVGVIHAALSAGPAIIMVVYNTCFVEEVTMPDTHSLSGFFLFAAISFGCINILGIIFYGHYPPSEIEEKESIFTSSIPHYSNLIDTQILSRSAPDLFIKTNAIPRKLTLDIELNNSMQSYQSNTDIQPSIIGDMYPTPPITPHSSSYRHRLTSLPSFLPEEESKFNSLMVDLFSASSGQIALSKKLTQEIYGAHSNDKTSSPLFSLDFHLFFWPCIFNMAFQMLFIQNLTTVLVSVHEEKYLMIFPYLTPIFGTIAKPAIGLCSDFFVGYISRTTYILIGVVTNMIVTAAAIYTIDSITMLLILTTVCDFSAYVYYAVGPALLIERFGMENFSRLWGMVMFGFAILTGMLLLIFGITYDMNCRPNQTICYGMECFFPVFVISTVAQVICLIMSVIFYIRHRGDIRLIIQD